MNNQTISDEGTKQLNIKTMNFWTIYRKKLKKDLSIIVGLSMIIGVLLCVIFSFTTDIRKFFILSAQGAIISIVIWWGNAFIVDLLEYKYSWFDAEAAALERKRNPSARDRLPFIKKEEIEIKLKT